MASRLIRLGLIPCVIILFIFSSSCQARREKIFQTEALGQVESRLEEASSLVPSTTNPGMFWTANDSGNPPEIFLIDQNAKTRLVCKLVTTRNRDWEDIAIGAGPVPGNTYVYVADIGDNHAQYRDKFIYRFEEPTAGKEKEIEIKEVDTITLHLPDGPRDSETIMIDPVTHDMLLVSKREDSVRLYFTPWPFGKHLQMKRVGTLPLTHITSGSISPDGKEVLLKDYERIYHWRRSSGQTLTQLFATPPDLWPYNREPQGEAITWAPDGKGYYTLSEGTALSPGTLYFYGRP